MNIYNNIEIVDLGLLIDKTLVIADTHIGFEEALNKQGILVPRFQFSEIIKRLEKILKLKKINRIIINGDVKHEFGRISDQEWRHTLKLLDFLTKYGKVILLKGNHDTILGPIAKKRNVQIKDYFICEFNENQRFSRLKSEILINKKKINIKKSLKKIKNKKIKILIIHGDKLDNNILKLIKKTDVIIIGHEHPAVSIKEGPRVETYKCFLKGKFKGKKLIVQPSFNLVTEGTDIIKEKLLSPFLYQNLSNFEVYVVADKVYDFGKLRNLK